MCVALACVQIALLTPIDSVDGSDMASTRIQLTGMPAWPRLPLASGASTSVDAIAAAAVIANASWKRRSQNGMLKIASQPTHRPQTTNVCAVSRASPWSDASSKHRLARSKPTVIRPLSRAIALKNKSASRRRVLTSAPVQALQTPAYAT